MNKTITFTVSDEMNEFIQGQVREHFHFTVSDYLRSLIRRDEVRVASGRSLWKDHPGPITMNEFMAMADEDY